MIRHISYDDRLANADLIAGAEALVRVASGLTMVLRHLETFERTVDGYPTATLTDGMPRGSSELTSVERAVDAIFAVRSEREDFRDEKDTILALAYSFERHIAIALERFVMPTAKAPTCDGKGLQGWEIRYTPYSVDPANGWYAEDCGKPVHRAKLCVGCYQRARRWRSDNSLPELNDDREVAA